MKLHYAVVYGVKNDKPNWYVLGASDNRDAAVLLATLYRVCWADEHPDMSVEPPVAVRTYHGMGVGSFRGKPLRFGWTATKMLTTGPSGPPLPLWEHDVYPCLTAVLGET